MSARRTSPGWRTASACAPISGRRTAPTCPRWVSAEVTRILEENMTRGTGVGAYFGKLSAGKTGTTDSFADAWFCGYTPALEATVWIGYPKGEIPMRDVHGISVSGPTFPATIWRTYMIKAMRGTKRADFTEPPVLPTW